MNNKPEWLDAALGGHPVVLRDGSKAYVRYCEEEYETKYPLLGGSVDAVSGEIYTESWAYDGSYIPGQTFSRSDIIGLWQEPAPVFKYWHLLKEDYFAIAMDKDGSWHTYSRHVPYISERHNGWMFEGTDCCCISEFFTKDVLPTVSDWRQSLILRPEGETNEEYT